MFIIFCIVVGYSRFTAMNISTAKLFGRNYFTSSSFN